MIIFHKYKNILVLSYYPEDFDNRFSAENSWVAQRFRSNQTIRLKRTFELSQSQLIQEKDTAEFDEGGYHFAIGNLNKNHYRLSISVFNTKNQFYIDKNLALNEKFFVAVRNTSILSKLMINVVMMST